MKPFIGVIAKGKSGKSTIIKSLTGCGRSNYRGFLKDNLTGETILVICGSPQEEALLLTELTDLLKAAVADPKCHGVVIAIQPRHTRTRMSMETIFEEAAKHDGLGLNAFIIDPGWNGDAAGAKEIPSRLDRFNARIETLDGRRFAAINARIINDATGLIPVNLGLAQKASASSMGHK